MRRQHFTKLLLVLLLSILPVASFAKGNIKVGDAIPHDLALKDSSGKMQSFNKLKGKKGITLVFVRSAEWCPYCQKQLIDLNKNAKKFSDAGYPVVSVSYDSVEKLNKFATKNKTDITLLSDPASESIRAFGILNEANAKGTFSYGIPHPGVYIVSKDKKAQAKFFTGDYTKRPSVDELLAEIKKLNPPPEATLDGLGEDPIIPGEDVIDIPEKIMEPVVLPEDVQAPEVTTPEAPAMDVLKPIEPTTVVPEAAPQTVPTLDVETPVQPGPVPE